MRGEILDSANGLLGVDRSNVLVVLVGGLGVLLLVKGFVASDGGLRSPAGSAPCGDLGVPHHRDLLKSLALGLGEQEVDVDSHDGAEDTEDDVGLPGDVLECGGDKHGQGKVEDPVCGSADTGGYTTLVIGEDLRAVQPDTGTPGRSKRGHKQIGNGNDSLGSLLTVDSDTDQLVGRNVLQVAGEVTEQDRHEQQPHAHEGGTGHEQSSATPAVNPEESRDSHDHVDNVLNGGRGQHSVSRITSHLEHVDNVVHHDIHTSKLLPDLGPQADQGTVERVLSEQINDGDLLGGSLDLDIFTDLLNLKRNVGVVDVTAGLNHGDDVDGFFPATLLGEPSGGFSKDKGTGEQNDTGDDHDTPGDSKTGHAIDVRAAKANVEHDHDTPSDGPLEEGTQTTTDVLGGKLGDVDGDSRGGQTDTETCNETAADKLGHVLGGGLNSTTNHPETGSNLDDGTTAELINKVTTDHGTQEGATGHGGRDAALFDGTGVTKVSLVVSLVDKRRD